VSRATLSRPVPIFALVGRYPTNKLIGLREIEVSGTDGGAVKCVDIIWNTGGESGSLGLF